MYFTFPNGEYNYCAKLIANIDKCKGTAKEIAKAVLYVVHGGLFLFTINIIIRLMMIEEEKDKKHWLLGILKNLFDK